MARIAKETINVTVDFSDVERVLAELVDTCSKKEKGTNSVFVVLLEHYEQYEYTQREILRVFSTENTAQEFIHDLNENWDHFQNCWKCDNRWGERFYLSMSPRVEDKIEIEQWPILDKIIP